MKRVIACFIATLLCFSLFCDEILKQVQDDSIVKPKDDSIIKAEIDLADKSRDDLSEPVETEAIDPLDDDSRDTPGNTMVDKIPDELFQTAVAPLIEPLDYPKPIHVSLSIISDEELEKPEVERFRNLYTSPKWSALLRSYLETAMEYRLYVRKAVQDKEMPEILEYLPVVESNYKTNAKSRSGAIGMWQFMANSVWPFLTLNDFVDERLDPWKSTDAALRKLTDNYNIFNDWLLAIGAYNCGVGAMNKAIKRAGGKKDFWYLAENGYLSKQTSEYVPKLIAIADLAINSEYYGIDIPNHDEEFEMLENEKNGNFDYVTVKKAYSLNLLAQEMRMDGNTLKKLNPSFTLGMTHPSKESQIRLPLGMKQSALDALANIKPVDFPLKYTVVAGDSLWSISRKYKTTVQAICELNGIKENAILKIGKILYIPSK